MDDKHLALTVSGDGIDEITQKFIAILVIDADTGFYRYRDGHHVAHRFDTVSYQLRIAHQAGAEHPVLHAVGRTADVEVDLIVTARLRQFRTLGERSRIAAAQLQGQRMLFFAIGQIVAFAMNNRSGRHHFGIQQRMARQQAQEIATVPVCPVEHRRDGKTMGGKSVRC